MSYLFSFLLLLLLLIHSLVLLVLESQRIESLLVTQFIDPTFIPNWVKFLHDSTGKTGPNLPNVTQCFIILYVLGFFVQELVELSTTGLVRYFNDLWNLVDTLINFLYFFWLLLRFYTIVQVYFIEPSFTSSSSILRQSGKSIFSSSSSYSNIREPFYTFDVALLEELSTSMFAAASIASFLKLVHIFSVHPHLGPLQISLGRMVFDILKFFFIYTWVLFAFACGLFHLLSNYSSKDSDRCAKGNLIGISPFDVDHSCNIWRRFSNLFETIQTLFWASFGLIDLQNFELTGIKEFTRFWSLLMFGTYSIINVVVLLNLLIAMMSDSYQVISAGRDTEWKFARSKLWISYFKSEGNFNRYYLSPPFNLFIPIGLLIQLINNSIIKFINMCFCNKFTNYNNKVKCKDNKIYYISGNIKDETINGTTPIDINFIEKGFNREQISSNNDLSDLNSETNDLSYHQVIRGLVRRYVIREQRKTEETGPVTEDDVKEVKQDISTFKVRSFVG